MYNLRGIIKLINKLMKYIYTVALGIIVLSMLTTNINYYRYLLHLPKNRAYITVTNLAEKIPCCKEVGYISDTKDPNIYYILQYMLAPQIVQKEMITPLTVANLNNAVYKEMYRSNYTIVEITKELSLLIRR